MGTETKNLLTRESLEVVVNKINEHTNELKDLKDHDHDEAYIKRIVNPKLANGTNNYAAVLVQSGNGGDTWDTLKYYSIYPAANNLMERDSAGKSKVQTPDGTVDTEVVNVKYVKQYASPLEHTHNNYILKKDNLKDDDNNPDGYSAVLVQSAHETSSEESKRWNTLKYYTVQPAKNTLAERTSTGRLLATAPPIADKVTPHEEGGNEYHVVNKSYVDGWLKGKAGSQTAVLPVINSSGNFSFKKYSSNPSLTAESYIVETDSTGHFNVLSPTSGSQPVPKSWVDTNFVPRTDPSNFWTRKTAYITSPTGILSHKRYTSEIEPSSFVHRDYGMSTFSTTDPVYLQHAVTKQYLDKKTPTKVTTAELDENNGCIEFTPAVLKDFMLPEPTCFMDIFSYFVEDQLTLGAHYITNSAYSLDNAHTHTVILEYGLDDNGDAFYAGTARKRLNYACSISGVDKAFSPLIKFTGKDKEYVIGLNNVGQYDFYEYDPSKTILEMNKLELDIFSDDLSDYNIKFWDIDKMYKGKPNVCFVQNGAGNLAVKNYSSSHSADSHIVETNSSGFFNVRTTDGSNSKHPVNVEYLEQRLTDIGGGCDCDGHLNLNFSQIYPIGSIYMSANNVSPSTLFPGTSWIQLKDRFLLGAGNTYIAGTTGEAATVTRNANPEAVHTIPPYMVVYMWQRVEAVYHCPICNRDMAESEKQSHINSLHLCPNCKDDEQTFITVGDTCTECGYINGGQKCSICPSPTWHINLSEHIAQAHTCQFGCGSNIADMTTHISTKHTCQYCGEIVETPSSHIATDHTCHYAGCNFTGNSADLAAHEANHCSKCGELMGTDTANHGAGHYCSIHNKCYADLATHNDRMHGSYRCPTCGLTWDTMEEVIDHLSTEHSDPDAGWCNICGQVVPNFTSHYNSQHGCSDNGCTDYPSCKYCGKPLDSSMSAGDSCYGDGHYCSTCDACIDDYDGHFTWSSNHNYTCSCGWTYTGDDPGMARDEHIEGGHCPKTKPDWAEDSSYGFCSKCKTWIVDFNSSYHYETCSG